MNRYLIAVLVAASAFVASYEARAVVGFGAAGAVATGTNALAVPHPAGIVAGNLLVLVIANKIPPAGPSTPLGWTLAAQAQGGAGADNVNDSGQVFVTVFTKVAIGGEAGNLAVTITGGNVAVGRMFRYTKTASAWLTATTTGSDNTAGAGWSVTGAANPGIASGDMVIVGSAANSDNYNWSAESISATGATFGVHTERQDSGSANGRDADLVVSDHTVTAGSATAAPVYTMTASGSSAPTNPAGASVILRIREANVTTLATGTDPAAATIAPGAAATDVNNFTLQTDTGTETVTSVTVNLSTNNGVGRLAITDNTPTELGFTTTPVSGSNTITVAGMSAGTAATTFRVRVTPLSHAAMPAVPGGSYDITAPVTAWAGGNSHTGTDTNPNALTIDNLSPGDVTGATATAGVTSVSLSWTNPAGVDSSFTTGGTVLVLQKLGSAVPGTDIPVEGTTYNVNDAVGTSTVVCVVTGSPPATGCSVTGLTAGSSYFYKIYTRDSRGNFSTPGVGVGPVTPLAAVSSFDACEVLSPTKCDPVAADFNRLFTKLADTGFALDLVALKSGGTLNTDFSGTASVDLLANTIAQAIGSDNCPTGASTATIPLGSAAFSGGRRNVSVAANAFSGVAPNYSAYRDVRVRVTCNAANCPPSGVTRCSADNFSVRPTDFSVSASVLTNTAQTGTPSAAAGSDFTLTASAVTATAAAAAGYTGQPTLDRTASKVATHVGDTDFTTRLRDAGGTNTVTFPAAVIGTGVSTATLQYHDAGNFKVLAGGLVDSSFTAVDDPTKDCVSGSTSNADNDADANNGLKYGCNVGNQSNSSLFGRFYPSYYTLGGGSVTAACVAGGYSYMGHAAMGLGFTVSAMSLDNPGGATQKLSKYTSGYATLASVNVLSEDGTVATDLTANLSPSLAYNSALWSAGDYVVSGSAYSFSRTTPAGPYDSFFIGAGVTDTDGAVLNGRDFKLGDPACTVSCTHKLLSAMPTRIRFGRLRLLNAIGAETLNLPLTLRAEYWNGSGFLTNTLDSCTALAASPAKKFVLFGWQGGITSGNMVTPTAGTDGNVSASGTFVSGVSSLSLLKPSPAAASPGSVRICLDLDSAAGVGDLSCQAVQPADLGHLQGNWDGGAAYNKDPSARSAFGLYGAQPRQFIFFREGY